MANTEEKFYKAVITFGTKDPEFLETALGHHLDYLIDFADAGDGCTSAGDTTFYDMDSKHDAPKLSALASILFDIMGENEPTEEDLNEDWNAIELYDNLRKVKESLVKMGLWGAS